MHQLFVYGTLRKGGISHHLLNNAQVIREGVWLKGYTLYSAGWYPLAVLSPDEQIKGDVVAVSEESWPELDAYEGDAYERVYLEQEGVWIYRFKGKPAGLPPVQGGDWLKWWQEQE